MKTKRLSGTRASDIKLAGEILRSGGVVSIPTETVYGLAANALDAVAVAKIFAAKGRPGDNPLIVHICEAGRLDDICLDVPESARALARAFWPGPLTLVLRKRPEIPQAVTAGLDTVGVRMPAHAAALAVIKAAGVPLAAPSANISGRPSPTGAVHVFQDFDGKIDAVLDGGECCVGVESTVLDMTGDIPVILRPGAVTREMLRKVVGEVGVLDTHADTGAAPKSPGLKYRHYAPSAPLTLFFGAPDDTAGAMLERAGEYRSPAVICFDEYLPQMQARFGERIYSLGESWDAEAHARRLFGLLRRADGLQALLAQCPRSAGRGAAAANRLVRAAGGNVVVCTKRPVIGVTGASGSGKSELSRVFSALGAAVLDADAIYKRLLRESEQMRGEIARRFPTSSREGDQIDIAALRQVVFASPQELAALSEITHPFVARELRERALAECANVLVLDVPVLFGSGIDRMCTATIGVVAPRKICQRRIEARDGIDTQAAQARLSLQPDDDFFRARCDIIIENEGLEPQINARGRQIFDEIVKNCQQK